MRRKSGFCAGFRICPDGRRSIIVRHHAHHEIGTARSCTRAFPCCRPSFHKPLGGGRGPVPNSHLVAGGQQICSHAGSHGSESQKGDLAHVRSHFFLRG